MTVVLFDRQIAFLDRLTATLRTQHGAAISRAQLIRAIVDAVGESVAAQGTTTDGLDAAILSKLGVATDEA